MPLEILGKILEVVLSVLTAWSFSLFDTSSDDFKHFISDVPGVMGVSGHIRQAHQGLPS